MRWKSSLHFSKKKLFKIVENQYYSTAQCQNRHAVYNVGKEEYIMFCIPCILNLRWKTQSSWISKLDLTCNIKPDKNLSSFSKFAVRIAKVGVKPLTFLSCSSSVSRSDTFLLLNSIKYRSAATQNNVASAKVSFRETLFIFRNVSISVAPAPATNAEFLEKVGRRKGEF